MTSTGIPLAKDELIQFENEIGHQLPDEYRKFIIDYNGGEPSPYHFYVPTWKYKCSLIQELKGIDPDYIEPDLRETIETMGDNLPKGFLIIGSDPGGNSIMISLEGETRGKVYFWDHEMQPDDRLENLDDYKNIHFLADSFEKFILSMNNYEDMDFG